VNLQSNIEDVTLEKLSIITWIQVSSTHPDNMTRRFLIHTGNILQLAGLKRKPGHTPADELHDSLKIQLSETSADGIKEIAVPSELSPLLISDERSSQKITVKLFLSTVDVGSIKEALDSALAELGAKQADLFILSWPHGMGFEQGKELWKAMESLVDNNTAHSLGISDIEIQEFIALHDFAKVKPEVIQINLESCCVVPAELVTFTRENSIQLLTHNDPQNILSSETFKTIASWLVDVHWTVRYQTLLRCRGIIKNKGYVINAEKA